MSGLTLKIKRSDIIQACGEERGERTEDRGDRREELLQCDSAG